MSGSDHVDSTGIAGAITVDGRDISIAGQHGVPLLDVLRRAGVTGPKRSCGRGECGACTVLVGDRPVMSCTLVTGLVDGPVTTVTKIAEDRPALVEAFADHAAFQCGFCTPGQVVRAEALLREGGELDRGRVAAAMSGNICRCTGYHQIIDAICDVAGQCSGGTHAS